MEHRKEIIRLFFDEKKSIYEIAQLLPVPAWQIGNIVNNKLDLNKIRGE